MRKENQTKQFTAWLFNAECYRLTKYVPVDILTPFSENHSTKMYRNLEAQKRDKIQQHVFLVALNLLHQSKLKQLRQSCYCFCDKWQNIKLSSRECQHTGMLYLGIILMQQKNSCLSMRKITYTTAVHNKVSQSIKKVSCGLQSEPIFKHTLPHLNFF